MPRPRHETEEEYSRICRRCRIERHIDLYGQYSSPATGRPLRRLTCNVCRRKEQNERYARDPDIKAKMKATAKAMHLKQQYGITAEVVEELKQKQDHRCAICKKQKPLCVDHNHKTKQIRALLCRACNFGIGYLQEDPNLMYAAAEYINKFNA